MKKSTLLAMLAIVGVVALGASACGDDDGDGDGDKGNTGTGGNGQVAATCEECMADKCASELEACEVADCSALVDCLDGCDLEDQIDTVCITACTEDHLTASQKRASLNICQGSNCYELCKTL